jgi:hypothetical protein
MRLILATTIILLSGCRTEFLPHTPSYSLGEEFNLRQGSNARVDGRWIIEFRGVPEDSRCPMNARCIWEGNARIALTIKDVSKPLDSGNPPAEATMELNTSDRFDRKKPIPGAGVELLHLEPSRMAGAPIKDYVATLVVKAAP